MYELACNDVCYDRVLVAKQKSCCRLDDQIEDLFYSECPTTQSESFAPSVPRYRKRARTPTRKQNNNRRRRPRRRKAAAKRKEPCSSLPTSVRSVGQLGRNMKNEFYKLITNYCGNNNNSSSRRKCSLRAISQTCRTCSSTEGG